MSADTLGAAKLALARAVNAEVNRLPYVTDLAQFGVSEHWQTTREMARRMAGDCEDSAILKACRLWDRHGFSQLEVTIAAGFVLAVPPSHVRYGHAVCLWWQHPTDPWVLDNGAVTARVARYSEVRDRLDLVAACNRDTVWNLLRRA